jgi:hypothetical protein
VSRGTSDLAPRTGIDGGADLPHAVRADTSPDAGADFVDALAAHLRMPGPATLETLRTAVLATPSYSPDLDPRGIVEPLLARGDDDAVVATLLRLMPGAFFSPSAHLALAEAFERLGDGSRAAREERLARAAVAGVLGSGDGSAERPWTVLRVSDEYDVLQAQQRTSLVQTLVRRDGRVLDRHQCSDGAEAWFAFPGAIHP